MKKLPIGIQTFEKIIEEDCCYVDKTAIAKRLIDSGSYYFLSRPRRFGKSLFLDTLAEIFKGSKELFEGLAIYDSWDWETKYPVIKISFDKGDFRTTEGITTALERSLQMNAECLNIPLDQKFLDYTAFAEFIKKVHDHFQQTVVILIDEYDKPILDNITREEEATNARNLLKVFYSAIKGSDQYLRFVFLTGVSKFSKMNLFSGLNNLQDITIDSNYATITGYTHEDLQEVFGEHLAGVNLEMVRKWYNGYNYFGEPIYNPFDILLFLANDRKFKNYWWETGNPSFLIEKLKEKPYSIPNLETIEVESETLNAFDVEQIDLIALLWQTGYLTFDKEIIDDLTYNVTYTMKVPNLEIQMSLNALFMDYLTAIGEEKASLRSSFSKALRSFDAVKVESILKSLFAAIPSDNYRRNDIAKFEGYYSSVIFTFFTSIGFDVLIEDSTNKGRIDLTIVLPTAIVLVECKVDSSESAIQQIHDRKYYEKYRSSEKPIYLMGINFSSKERNVAVFEWEKM